MFENLDITEEQRQFMEFLTVNGLDTRCYNALLRNNIKTMEDFKKLTTKRIKDMRNLGEVYSKSLIDFAHNNDILFLDEVSEEEKNERLANSFDQNIFTAERISNVKFSDGFCYLTEDNIKVLNESGIFSLKDLSKIKKEDFKMILGGNDRALSEITRFCNEYSIKFLDNDISIDKLNLSTRSHNILYRAGIRDVSKLTSLTEEDVDKIRNISPKVKAEVYSKVHAMGLHFGDEEIIDDTNSIKERIDKKEALLGKIESLQSEKAKLLEQEKELDSKLNSLFKEYVDGLVDKKGSK